MRRILPELLNNIRYNGMFFELVMANVLHLNVAGWMEPGALDRHDAITATVAVTRNNQGGYFSSNALG